jgi:hypothetical protein
MKRFMRVLLIVLLAATGVTFASPAEAAPYCGIRWGSLAKTAGGTSNGNFLGVRTGQHACYDRLVIDVAGTISGYSVGYTGTKVGERGIFDGNSSSGPDLRGRVTLSIRVNLAATDAAGNPTFAPRWHYVAELADVSHYRTFRQVAGGSGYQGYAILGIGVRARLPFRVFTLAGPGGGSRIVIDVAHRW